MTNSTMNVAIHFPYYYYNKNYYSIFVTHEFVQEDFYTSLKCIGATQNRDEAIILAICKHIHK